MWSKYIFLNWLKDEVKAIVSVIIKFIIGSK